MAPPSVRVLLFNSELGDLLKRKEKLKVVSIRESVTVETALATLAKHKILSAPVLSQPADEAAGQDGDLECLCFVDIRDVLNAFLQSGTPMCNCMPVRAHACCVIVIEWSRIDCSKRAQCIQKCGSEVMLECTGPSK